MEINKIALLNKLKIAKKMSFILMLIGILFQPRNLYMFENETNWASFLLLPTFFVTCIFFISILLIFILICVREKTLQSFLDIIWYIFMNFLLYILAVLCMFI